MKTILDKPAAKPSVLILMPEANESVSKSAHNLENVKTLHTNYLNIRDLLGHEYVLISKAALTAVETFFDSAQPGGAAVAEGK